MRIKDQPQKIAHEKCILEIIGEIEQWNSGDEEVFVKYGEVSFDGSFVFKARQKRLTALKKELNKLLQ